MASCARPAVAAFTIALTASILTAAPAPLPITVTPAARSMQPGELVVFTVVTAEPVDAIHIKAFDHDLPPYRVDPTTWRVLVGIDLDATTGAHPVTFDAGAAHTTYSLVVKPKAFATRKLTVDEGFVNPPATETKRIADDAALLAKTWANAASEKLWSDGFVRPVAEAANSAFGKRSVFNGQPRGAHGGADFESPAGTPVKAPAEGRVVVARSLYYSGNTVVLDHGLGLFSLFAHFSAIGVHEGDLVTRGQVLGKVGATGRVTGPHLHWAVRAGGARVDPLSLLALLPR